MSNAAKISNVSLSYQILQVWTISFLGKIQTAPCTTVCPRSLVPRYVVTYYLNCVKISWTYRTSQRNKLHKHNNLRVLLSFFIQYNIKYDIWYVDRLCLLLPSPVLSYEYLKKSVLFNKLIKKVILAIAWHDLNQDLNQVKRNFPSVQYSK